MVCVTSSSLVSQPPATGGGDPASSRSEMETDARVRVVAKEHFDEFSAPSPLVKAVLIAEGVGVVRNGLAIPLAFVNTTSPAAIGLGWALAPLHLLYGVIAAAVAIKLLPSCFADFEKALKSASLEEKWRSGLNVLDKILLLAIGISLSVVAFLIVVSLAGAAAAAAVSIASAVFAVLVTVRGVEMMVRGGYALWKSNQFQKEFLDQCKIGNAAQWLRGEQLRDPVALKNRIGQSACDALADALAKVDLNQPIDKQLVQLGVHEPLMKSVDRGICEEKLKQQLIVAVGTIMFVGGALSIPTIAASHGLLLPAIGVAFSVAGSVFSLGMEALWMPYDNPAWFRKLAAYRYSMHERDHPLQGVRAEANKVEILSPTCSEGVRGRSRRLWSCGLRRARCRYGVPPRRDPIRLSTSGFFERPDRIARGASDGRRQRD